MPRWVAYGVTLLALSEICSGRDWQWIIACVIFAWCAVFESERADVRK